MAVSDPVRVRFDSGGMVADLITLDSVSDLPGNGAAIAFCSNSVEDGLARVLGRLRVMRQDNTQVRLELAVSRSVEALGDVTYPALSIVGPSGAIGVGTTSPQAALDVNGGLKTSADATFGGGLAVAGVTSTRELHVIGSARVDSGLQVAGEGWFGSLVTQNGASIGQQLIVGGNLAAQRLNVQGAAVISGSLTVGQLNATGATLTTTVTGSLEVNGPANFSTLQVRSTASFDSGVQVNGVVQAQAISTSGSATLGGDLSVVGAITGGRLFAGGDGQITGTLAAAGLLATTATIAGAEISTLVVASQATVQHLAVRSGTTIEGGLTARGAVQAEQLTVTSSSSFGGSLAVNGTLSCGAVNSQGDVNIGGTLLVTLPTRLSQLRVSGDVQIGAGLSVQGTLTAPTVTAGELVLSSSLRVGGRASLESDLVVAGRLGVGVEQPAASLDVRGSAQVSQVFFADQAGQPYHSAWIGPATTIDGPTRWLHVGGIDDGGVRRLALYANVVFAPDRFGVRTTNPDPAYALEVGGTVATPGVVYPSDVRLKTDLLPLGPVLSRLCDLRAVRFHWSDGRASRPGRELGVLAQEVEAHFPELVSTAEGTGYKAVDYARLSAVLLAAVQELHARVETLALQKGDTAPQLPAP